MAILTKDMIPKTGPFIEFCDCPESLQIEEHDWPTRDLYEKHIFFDFGDSLLDAYCGVTRCYTPFDPYALTQLRRSDQIMALSSEFLLWATMLARYRPDAFSSALWIYDDSLRFATGVSPTPDNLKEDMLDTLLFLADRIHRIAFSKRCLVIVGI